MRMENCHIKRIIIIMLLFVLLVATTGCGKKEHKATVYSGKIVVEKMDSDTEKFENPEETLNVPESPIEQDVNYADDEANKEHVDLIFFMGQSNMAGYGGDATKAPKVSEDAGLEYRVISDPDTLHPIEEPFGAYENKEGGLSDNENMKKGSLVSAFVNKYYELTNKKVIAVSASVGGMAMDLWLMDSFYQDAIERITDSVDYLKNNNYVIDHVFVLWLQGESDGNRDVPGETYKEYFFQFMEGILATDVEKVFLITPGQTYYNPDAYTKIIDAQKEICYTEADFVLATSVLSDIDVSMMADEFHYGQEALNIVGEKSAESLAEFAYGVIAP